jgi:hypothetical protein
MIDKIFKIVQETIEWLGKLTGFTYNEMNIIMYFLVIPFTWLCMLDYIFSIHYLKIGFGIITLGFYFGCRDFKNYSDQLFYKSVDFIGYFNRFGSNYYKSSVWICVAIPILIYICLIISIIKV